jgi:hypothetical protein
MSNTSIETLSQRGMRAGGSLVAIAASLHEGTELRLECYRAFAVQGCSEAGFDDVQCLISTLAVDGIITVLNNTDARNGLSSS